MATLMTKPQTAVEKVLQCNQCKNQMKQPHTLLHCLHSLCKACLDGLPKKRKDLETGWNCPACSDFCEEQNVRHNSFLEELILFSTNGDKNKQQTGSCGQCLKQDKCATGRCVDCKIKLCDECHFSHLQIPTLKHHQISVLGLGHDKYVDKLIFCPTHQSKLLEFNCVFCEELTCQICNISAHHSHRIQTTTQAVECLIPKLKSNITELKSYIGGIEAQLKAIDQEIQKTKEIYSSCRLEMDDRLEKLINNLKAKTAQQEDEVTEQETISLDHLQNIKLTLRNHFAKAQNLITLAEVTTNKAKNTSLLHELYSGGLYSNVRKCSNNKPDTIDFKVKYPELYGNQKFDQIIGGLYYSDIHYNINAKGKGKSRKEFTLTELPKDCKRKFRCKIVCSKVPKYFKKITVTSKSEKVLATEVDI